MYRARCAYAATADVNALMSRRQSHVCIDEAAKRAPHLRPIWSLWRHVCLILVTDWCYQFDGVVTCATHTYTAARHTSTRRFHDVDEGSYWFKLDWYLDKIYQWHLILLCSVYFQSQTDSVVPGLFDCPGYRPKIIWGYDITWLVWSSIAGSITLLTSILMHHWSAGPRFGRQTEAVGLHKISSYSHINFGSCRGFILSPISGDLRLISTRASQ